jgi:hypothetical protein
MKKAIIIFSALFANTVIANAQINKELTQKIVPVTNQTPGANPCATKGYKHQTKPNLLPDGNFEMPRTGIAVGSPVEYSGEFGSLSCAQQWTTWGTAPQTIVTKLLPSTCPYGSGNMMYVKLSGGASGIADEFLGDRASPLAAHKAIMSAWVYVVQGSVSIGAGNGGSTSGTATTCGTGHWEYLETCNRDDQSPVTEVIVYGSANSIYYVDNVRLTKVN